MSRNLKARLAALESGHAHGVVEHELLNDLPDYPGQPGYAMIGKEAVPIAEGETEAAFKARCRAMAGPGAVIAYCLWRTT